MERDAESRPKFLMEEKEDKTIPKDAKCSGIRTSWPWKGYPCGSIPKYKLNGKHYCGTHFAKAIKDQDQEENKGR